MFENFTIFSTLDRIAFLKFAFLLLSELQIIKQHSSIAFCGVILDNSFPAMTG